MLANVDKLGVAVSGGADSLALLDVLVSLDLPVPLIPVHILQHPLYQRPEQLTSFVHDRYGIETHVVRADTSTAAREAIAAGKAPCRACAPVRAVQVGEAARALGLGAVAFGHHLDDAAATLLMNVFHTGKVDTMRPVARRKTHPDIPILRPMLLVPESQVKAASPAAPDGLFDCGMCSLHAHERARASRFVAEMFGNHRPAADHVAHLVTSLAESSNSPRNSNGRVGRPR
jgi:tRNA 2-thiocytidine biosynthesis protein TtcA